VLDEPTNHLDLDSRGALENALQEYTGTLLVVSHDRYFLDAVVRRVLVIEGDTARVHEGNYSAYREARLQAETARREAEAAAREAEKQARLREERAARRERKAGAGAEPGPTPAQLRRRAEQLEEQAAELEGRIARVEALLSGSEVYQDPARVQALSIEHQRLQTELQQTYQQWEEVAGG